MTERKLADDCIHEFIEIKYQLDELGEGREKSACVGNFYNAVSGPDYAENDRTLEYTSANLVACVISVRKVQKYLTINADQNYQIK